VAGQLKFLLKMHAFVCECQNTYKNGDIKLIWNVKVIYPVLWEDSKGQW
jgi:hypothetical protein